MPSQPNKTRALQTQQAVNNHLAMIYLHVLWWCWAGLVHVKWAVYSFPSADMRALMLCHRLTSKLANRTLHKHEIYVSVKRSLRTQLIYRWWKKVWSVCVVQWHLVSVRISSVMYNHTLVLCLKIIRQDIRPDVKWAVNLVIADSQVIFHRGLCGCIYVNP